MKRLLILFAAASLGLTAPATASAQRFLRDIVGEVIQAQDNPDRGGGRRPPRDDPRPSQPGPGREISMSQAIKIVEQAAGRGHHLDARREDRGGRPVYRIQWASDGGERRDYIVDALSGAVSR
jgi:uncharacterized membrane protein YkoI